MQFQKYCTSYISFKMLKVLVLHFRFIFCLDLKKVEVNVLEYKMYLLDQNRVKSLPQILDF